MNGNDDLKNKPWKISSMTEFIKYFGGAPELSFTVDIKKYNPGSKKDEDGKVVPENAVLIQESKVFQYDVNQKRKNKFPNLPKTCNRPFEKVMPSNYAFYINGRKQIYLVL